MLNLFKLAEARTSSRSQCLAVSCELSQVSQSGPDIKQGQSGDKEDMKLGLIMRELSHLKSSRQYVRTLQHIYFISVIGTIYLAQLSS